MLLLKLLSSTERRCILDTQIETFYRGSPGSGPKDVLVLMGSDSDWKDFQYACRTLNDLDISHDVHVASAHRDPEKVESLAKVAEVRGYKAIIACAGLAAALAGMCASLTNLPVIAVAIAGS